MPRETKKGIVLLAIGIYATLILAFKVFFAVIHHIKWMLFEKCCRRMRYDKFRIDRLTEFWKEENKNFIRSVDDI